MELPQDLKHYGRRIEDGRRFLGRALLGIVAVSIFIGYVIGFLSR